MKPSTIVKIAIAEDHALFREGMRHILEEKPGYEVAGLFCNGLELIRSMDLNRYDIVLMDIEMPEMNGLEATLKAREKEPEIKILVLSMYGDPELYHQLTEAGVNGFILKDSPFEEIFHAIDRILTGGSYFSQELLRRILSKLSETNSNNSLTKPTAENNLTDRELDVLKYLVQGLSNHEIAEKLFISQRTVEGHRANLLKKTNTKNTVQLVVFALKNNWCEF